MSISVYSITSDNEIKPRQSRQFTFLVSLFTLSYGKMPRRNLTNKEKLSLINDVENCNYDDKQIQRVYQISRASFYRCLSNKDSILSAIENGQGKRAR